MDMEQFSLLLCDVYQMDYTVCTYDLRWRGEFEKTSLQQWAIDEIRRYVAGWLRPRTEGKVQDYIEAVGCFARRMKLYSGFQNNPSSKHFKVAWEQAMNVLDLLNAMK